MNSQGLSAWTVFKRVCGRSHSAVMCSAGEVPKGQGCRRFPSLHHSSQWLQKFGRSSPARHPQVWFCVRYINSISQVYCVTIGVASRSVRMKAGFSWAIQAWTPKSNKGQILTNNNNCKVSWCVLHTHFLYNVSLQLLYSYISLPLESSVLSCLSLSLSLSCFLSFLVFCFLSPSLPICATLWSYSGWCIAHTQMQDQWEHVLCHQVLQLPFLHLKQNSQVKSGWLKRKPFVYCIYLHSIVATFLGTRLCVVWSHQHILLDHVGSFLPRVLSDLFC